MVSGGTIITTDNSIVFDGSQVLSATFTSVPLPEVTMLLMFRSYDTGLMQFFTGSDVALNINDFFITRMANGVSRVHVRNSSNVLTYFDANRLSSYVTGQTVGGGVLGLIEGNEVIQTASCGAVSLNRKITLGNLNMKSKLYCYKLYNKALTADELKTEVYNMRTQYTFIN